MKKTSVTTPLHVQMLRRAREKREFGQDELYGVQWGRPDVDPALRSIRDEYLYPYIDPDHVALEIGPGGGRWTKYLLSFGRVLVVDHYQDLLDELTRSFKAPHLMMIRNNGTDFPEVTDGSVNFIWSYGVFVHLGQAAIADYLESVPRILAPDANVVLHYADKTKIKAQKNRGFSDNDPEAMRKLVEAAGFEVAQENTDLLEHSAIMRLKHRR
jgi:phospholipid N-methyltransferase